MTQHKQRHIAYNAASRDQWSGFAEHRRKVSELLSVGADPSRTRLCVLGAGNGNDLELPALLETHCAVHVVDLDRGALLQGAERQGVAGHPSLRLFGDVDLTGLLEAITGFTPATAIRPAALAALAERPAQAVPPVLAGPYDVVASTCLHSPLIGNAFHSVGEAHPQFMAMVQAIRTGHLRLMAELTAPGGTMILVTDLSSSDLLPDLRSIPDASLAGLFSRMVRDRSYFHGLNPEVLGSIVEQDPILRARVAGRESIAPWRWRLHARVYIVWALKFRLVDRVATGAPWRVDKPRAGPDNRGAGAIGTVPTRYGS
jgi:hypothetical protein